MQAEEQGSWIRRENVSGTREGIYTGVGSLANTKPD